MTRWTRWVLGVLLAAAWASPLMAQTAEPELAPGGAAARGITGEYGYSLPPDVSTHGYQIDRLINWMHVFMLALFVGWGVFFVYCLVKYRARPGHTASDYLIKAKASKACEVAVVVVEAVLLLALSMPAWASLKHDFPGAEDNPLEVRVVAEQFAWNFHYAGPDGEFGRTDPSLMGASNQVGLVPDDPHGEDDVVMINEFHMPVGRPVIARLTSKDVIHSFSIPVLRIKQDMIPGMEVPVWFEAKEDGVGKYDIACAQLCGLGHYRMRGTAILQTQEDFNAWLETAGEDEFFDEDEFD